MNIIKKIPVAEEMVILLQEAELKCRARRDIIKYILENVDFDVPNERFERYQKELEQNMFIYERLKLELEKAYVLPNCPDFIEKKYAWKLNYGSNNITILENYQE